MTPETLAPGVRSRFRHWRRTRPFWGGLWAVLGGLLILVGPLTAIKVILVAGQVVWMGISVGAMVAIFGLFLWFSPSQRQIAGVLIVVLSLISFITSDFGGFLVGMILGLVGGAMGFAWVPRPAPRTAAVRSQVVLVEPLPALP